MAVRVTRPDPPAIERIRQHRRPARSTRPSNEALRTLRDVVQRSNSVDDAMVAVKAIRTAWADASASTRDAAGLLIAILDLSDSVGEALATWAMVRNDGALVKPLSAIRQYVHAEFPDATMRLVPGDEVAAAYLNVRIPTRDYPSFWDAQAQLLDWVIAEFPGLSETIQTVPIPASTDV